MSNSFDYLESNFLLFFMDDFIVPSGLGGHTDKNINDFYDLLLDDKLKNLINNLNIFSDQSLYDSVKDFLKESRLIYTPQTAIQYNQYNTILPKHGQKWTAPVKSKNYPQTADFDLYLDISNEIIKEIDVTKNKGKMFTISKAKHATSIVVENNGNSYNVHYANTGFGAQYHHTITNDSDYNEAVISFDSISKNKLLYFLTLLHIVKDHHEIYNICLGLLARENYHYGENEIAIKLTSTSNKVPVSDYGTKKETHVSDNYFETQYIGNCSLRAVYFPLYIFICKINNNTRQNFENFIFICKLFLYYKFLNDIYSLINSQSDKLKKFCEYSDDSISSKLSYKMLKHFYEFYKDFFLNKEISYFTDNKIIEDYIEDINKIEKQIDDLINACSHKANINVTSYDNRPTINAIDKTISSKINEKIYTDFEDFCNNFKASQNEETNNFVKFLLLNKLGSNYNQTLDDNIKSLYTNYVANSSRNVSSFSTIFGDPIKDICNLGNMFFIRNTNSKKYNLLEVQEITKLTPDHLIFLIIFNEYLKELIIPRYKPNSIDITKFNSKYTSLQVSSNSSYNEFKIAAKRLFENNYLNYITDYNLLLEYLYDPILKPTVLGMDSKDFFYLDNTKTKRAKFSELKNRLKYNEIDKIYVSKYLTPYPDSINSNHNKEYIVKSMAIMLLDTFVFKKTKTNYAKITHLDIYPLLKTFITSNQSDIQNKNLSDFIEYLFTSSSTNLDKLDNIDISDVFLESKYALNSIIKLKDTPKEFIYVGDYADKPTNLYTRIIKESQFKNLESLVGVDKIKHSINQWNNQKNYEDVFINTPSQVSGYNTTFTDFSATIKYTEILVDSNNIDKRKSYNKKPINPEDDSTIIFESIGQGTNTDLQLTQDIKDEIYNVIWEKLQIILSMIGYTDKLNTFPATVISEPILDTDKIVNCGESNYYGHKTTLKCFQYHRNRQQPYSHGTYIKNNDIKYYVFDYSDVPYTIVAKGSKITGSPAPLVDISKCWDDIKLQPLDINHLPVSQPFYNTVLGPNKTEINDYKIHDYKQDNDLGKNIDIFLARLRTDLQNNKDTIKTKFYSKFGTNINLYLKNLFITSLIIPKFFNDKDLIKNAVEFDETKNANDQLYLRERIWGEKIPDEKNSTQLKKFKDDLLISNQCTLPFIINDFIYNPFESIRKIDNYYNLIPNIFLLEGFEEVTNLTDTHLSLYMSKYDGHKNYKDNLNAIFSNVNIKDINNFFKKIKNETTVIQIFSKTLLIIFYLCIRLISFDKNSIESIQLVYEFLDEHKKIIINDPSGKTADELKQNPYYKLDQTEKGILENMVILLEKIYNYVYSKEYDIFYNFKIKLIDLAQSNINNIFLNAVTVPSDFMKIISYTQSLIRLELLHNLYDKNIIYQPKVTQLEDNVKDIVLIYLNTIKLGDLMITGGNNNSVELNKLVYYYKINSENNLTKIKNIDGEYYSISYPLIMKYYDDKAQKIENLDITSIQIWNLDSNINDVSTYQNINNYRIMLIESNNTEYRLINFGELNIPKYYYDNYFILQGVISNILKFVPINPYIKMDFYGNISSINQTTEIFSNISLTNPITKNNENLKLILLSMKEMGDNDKKIMKNKLAILKEYKINHIEHIDQIIFLKKNGDASNTELFIYMPENNLLLRCIRDLTNGDSLYAYFLNKSIQESSDTRIKLQDKDNVFTKKLLIDTGIYKVVNNDINFKKYIGNNNNILLLQNIYNTNNVKILYSIFYEQSNDIEYYKNNKNLFEDKYIVNLKNNKPIILEKTETDDKLRFADKEDMDKISPIKKKAYKELMKIISIENNIKLKFQYYIANKAITFMNILDCEYKEKYYGSDENEIKNIYFNNKNEVMQFYFISALQGNYQLTKFAFSYINKNLKQKELHDYYNYLNPMYLMFYPSKCFYLYILGTENELKKDIDVSSISTNNHYPKHLQLSKSFFDLCATTINYNNQQWFLQNLDRYISSTELVDMDKTKDSRPKKYPIDELLLAKNLQEIKIETNETIIDDPKLEKYEFNTYKTKYIGSTSKSALDILIYYYLTSRDLDPTEKVAIIFTDQKTSKKYKLVIDQSFKNNYLGFNSARQRFKYIENYSELLIIDLSPKLDFSILELNNIKQYLIEENEIETLLKELEECIKIDELPSVTLGAEKPYSEENYRYLEKPDDSLKVASAIDEYRNANKKYNFIGSDKKASIDTFREKMGDFILKKYEIVFNKIKTYADYEKYILSKQNISSLTNDVKMTENLFFKTLLEKYETSLYKLGYDVEKQPGDILIKKQIGNSQFNIGESLDLFMVDVQQNPGYTYKSTYIEKDKKYIYELQDSFKVNTLIIFFEHFNSIREKKKSRLRGGMLMRKEQYKLIMDILDKECNIKAGNKFYQLIMGAGKSSFIAPLLSLLLIAKQKFPIHVLPEYLVEQGKANFEILNNFGITTISKKENRASNIKDKNYIFDEISGTNNGRLNFLFSDSTIKSILLNTVNKGNMNMIEFLKSKMNNSFLIFDEVDDISHPFKCELNYPLSNFRVPMKEGYSKIKFLTDFLSLFYIKIIADQFYDNPNPTDVRSGSRADFEKYEVKISSNGNKLYYYNHDKEINSIELCDILNRRWIEINRIINDFIPGHMFELIDILNPYLFKKKCASIITTLGGNESLYIKLDFLFSFFFKILRLCFTSLNRKEYGTAYLEGPDYTPGKEHTLLKSNILAIPFKGVDNPSLTSEFSDINITLAYTVCAYLGNEYILRPGDINIILKEYKLKKDKSTDKKWDDSFEKQYFTRLFESLTNKTSDEIEKYYTFEKIKEFKDINPVTNPSSVQEISNTKYLINVFTNYISQKVNIFVKEYSLQLNSTFSDICSSDFCENRTGFSGTPYFLSPIDRSEKKTMVFEPSVDPIAEGSIFYSIVNDNVKVRYAENLKDLLSVLSNKINGDKVDYDSPGLPGALGNKTVVSSKSTETFETVYENSYKTIIDVGAYFVGFSPLTIAQKILEDCKQYDTVVYVNEEDKLFFIQRDDKDPSKFTNPQEASQREVDFYNSGWRFIVFFDQKHITGIDVKFMPLNAIGLVTMKYKTGIRDFGQGAYRLRKINITQKIHICIDKNTNSIINNELKREKKDISYIINFNGPNQINDEIEVRQKLLELLYGNENNIKVSKIKLQAIHNFRTIFRYHLLSKNNYRVSFSEKFKTYAVNVFAIQATKPYASSLDDIGKKIIDLYIDELHDTISLFEKLGMDHKMILKLNELCRIFISLRNSDDMISTQESESEMIAEMEAEQEQQQEQQQQNINLQFVQNIYDLDLDKNEAKYLIAELLNLGNTNISKRIVDHSGDLLNPITNEKKNSKPNIFIDSGYNDYLIYSKLFYYKNYILLHQKQNDMKYNFNKEGTIDIKPEFNYVILKIYHKYIIITQEEYVQLYVYFDEDIIKNNIELNFNYNLYGTEYHDNLSEFIMLVDYFTDKVISDENVLTKLLDNFITYDQAPTQFVYGKYNSVNYSSIDIYRKYAKKVQSIFNFITNIFTIETVRGDSGIIESKLGSLNMLPIIINKLFNVNGQNNFNYILDSENLLDMKRTDPTNQFYIDTLNYLSPINLEKLLEEIKNSFSKFIGNMGIDNYNPPILDPKDKITPKLFDNIMNFNITSTQIPSYIKSLAKISSNPNISNLITEHNIFTEIIINLINRNK
jgi:hypothetical protein